MASQAHQVMTRTVAVKSFIKATQYNGEDTLEGHGAEGGALWLEAQRMYPDAVWSDAFKYIKFADGSKILFIRAPDSSLRSTYKAVES